MPVVGEIVAASDFDHRSNLIYLISGAVVIFFVPIALAIYNSFIHPLADLPGPKLYAASDFFYLRQLIKGDWPFTLSRLHDKYGPIVRYAPNDVSFIDAAAWKDIYGHRTATRETMSKDLRQYRPTLTASCNILVANDTDHSRMRRLLSHAFSEKALRGQEDLIRGYVDKLIYAMRVQADKPDPSMDLVKWYNFMTFDILGDLSFGESFGCLESGGYHPWVESIFAGFKLSTYMTALKRHPSLFPFVKWFLPAKLMRDQAQHQQLSFETAKKRVLQGPTDHPDFMSYVLRHTDEKGLTPDEIGENANILIVAGSETTATLLSGVTFWLLKNPSVYKTLVAEIRRTFKHEDEITLEAVSGLPYLLSCLKEALRLYPPIPSGLQRVVPSGGAMIAGSWVAESAIVSVSHYAAYRSSQNFTDPAKFVPERWLGDNAKYARDAKDVVEPFSYGPRNCLGMNLANAEMRLATAKVLFNFDLELHPESIHWGSAQKIYVFWEKPSLKVLVKHRGEKSA